MGSVGGPAAAGVPLSWLAGCGQWTPRRCLRPAGTAQKQSRRNSPAPALTPPARLAAFGLTLVWALVAVFEHTDSTLVGRAALAAIVLLAVLSIASVLRRPGPEPRYEHPDVHEPLRPSLDGP